ncbi:MAG TPA: ABC transporter permease [Aggregatilineales bacterium]|nr:ABC transporter permease [Anaerolineales bacterium]HRE47754.1 ABC transporter permease [Aggregatilineales bacterium]
MIARIAVALREGLGGAARVLIPAAILVTVLIVVIIASLGKDSGAVLSGFLNGALGSARSRADVIMLAVPMLLCASGLLLTYTAGLWNIGVEGQVTMGAIFATILARSVAAEDVSPLIVPAEILLAGVGGALWAAATAFLRVRGGVNEIFGGVALNFISINVLLWLLNGEWKSGTYPQTADFAPGALLPTLPGSRLSPGGIALALGVWLAVLLALRGTRWGLQLRAMGQNPRSAALLGVRTGRHIFLALMVCGALAGMAGAVQAIYVRGRLSPGISGGIGFMGILIVLLVNIRAGFVPFVALAFAVVPIGSLKLASALDEGIKIDAALGNTFQGALVLAVLLANGYWVRRASKRKPL